MLILTKITAPDVGFSADFIINLLPFGCEHSYMLKRSTQADFFLKRWKSVRIHLEKFRESHDLEELHQLRLDVKKMRACLFLQQGSFKPHHLPDSFDPIEEIFQKAGKIRSADVSLRLLKRYGIRNKKINAKMDKIIREGSERFIKKTDLFLEKISVVKKEIPATFRDVDVPEIKKIAAKQLKLIGKEFREKQKPELLHEARKNLKNLLYIHAMLDLEIANEIRLNTGYLHELEQLIGKWHDLDFTISLIRKTGHAAKNSLQLHLKRKKVLSKIYLKTEKFERTVFLGKQLDFN